MVQVRQAVDESWTRLALILGVVAAFTLATAYSNDANQLS